MKKQARFGIFLGILSLLGLLACSEPDDKTDRLEIKTSSPITIAIGDTCPLLIVSKTTTDARGRTATTNPYRSFQLSSKNPEIAGIISLQRILGQTLGETKVVAKDENSALISDSITIQVIAKVLPSN